MSTATLPPSLADGGAAPPSGAASASYVPPVIPSSVRASFSAWLRSAPARDAAAAQLHLYQRHAGPYFAGASVGNAPAPRAGASLQEAWDAWKAEQQAGAPPAGAEARAAQGRGTIGTAINPANGKVGFLRLVDIDAVDADEPSSSASSSTAGSGSSLFSSLWARASSAPARQIHTLEIGDPCVSARGTPDAWAREQKVVLLHGYGAGTAFEFGNVGALGSLPPAPADSPAGKNARGEPYESSRFFALDWLGMGLSSRPPFHIARNPGLPDAAGGFDASRIVPGADASGSSLSPDARAQLARTLAAEAFFVESLEAWRARMRIERFTIVGHSLGGYLSIAYALRFPERIERIVLLSPAGIPPNPEEDLADAFRSKNDKPADMQAADAAATEERQQDAAADVVAGEGAAQERLTSGRAGAPLKAKTAGSDPDKWKASPTPKEMQSGNAPPRIGKKTRAVFTWLWDQNFSPFGLIRGSVFFGPMMTGRYTRRRFGALEDEDLRALHAYSHAIFSSKGSSEYCLGHILAPGAFARFPMINRVGGLKVPVSFLYGRHDWMDAKAGREACAVLARAGNTKASCFVIEDAGHHLYLDNPKATNSLLARILRGDADGQVQ